MKSSVDRTDKQKKAWICNPWWWRQQPSLTFNKRFKNSAVFGMWARKTDDGNLWTIFGTFPSEPDSSV